MDKTKISSLAKKAKNVVANVYEKHKVPIIACVSAVAAHKVSETYSEWCIARGLYRFHAAGIVKFFDFEGNEISMDECNKLIAEHIEELKKIPIKR